MAIRNIIQVGDPTLRKKSFEVTDFGEKTIALLEDMKQTLAKSEGIGLAAPQIGVSKRIVVIDVGDGLVEMINPVIVNKEGSVVGGEGCLSVPEYEGEVERAEKVECEFTDRSGKRYLMEANGLMAVAIQHELDHLDGVLFIDKAQTIMPKQKEKLDK